MPNKPENWQLLCLWHFCGFWYIQKIIVVQIKAENSPKKTFSEFFVCFHTSMLNIAGNEVPWFVVTVDCDCWVWLFSERLCCFLTTILERNR